MTHLAPFNQTGNGGIPIQTLSILARVIFFEIQRKFESIGVFMVAQSFPPPSPRRPDTSINFVDLVPEETENMA